MEAIKDEMKLKVKDSEYDAKNARYAKYEWKNSVENDDLLSKNVVRNMLARIRKEEKKLRETLKQKNLRSTKFKIDKWKTKSTDELDSRNLRNDPELVK